MTKNAIKARPAGSLHDRARAGYRVRGVDFLFVTGMDAAGVVERTGSNANGFKQGGRVITWSAANGKTWGSYAELKRVPVRNVSPMPKSLNGHVRGKLVLKVADPCS